MSRKIYQYQSYKQYLKDELESGGPKSGLKRRAAEALGVHTTFISQVVLGKAELSLDQAERMNDFLKHSEEEGDFFLELVILERASEPALKKRFEKRIKEKYSEQIQIAKHIQKNKSLSTEDEEKFYSSHLYGVLHVLSSLPRMKTREDLIKAAGFPSSIVHEAIDFLLKIGVLKNQNGRILPGEEHIHLNKNSKHIWKHHSNWRLATLQHFGLGEENDLHYSLSFSCSKQDAMKIREMILKNLKEMSEEISRSPEEEMYVYCFDFFKWT